MHAITPHIEFKHIKEKENIWLTCPGLHSDNDSEKPGQEYGKSIFGTDENMINSLDSDQNLNYNFEIDGRQYLLYKKT